VAHDHIVQLEQELSASRISRFGWSGTMVRWPHWRDITNVWFSMFLDFRKVAKLPTSIERPKTKSFLPLDSTGGSASRPSLQARTPRSPWFASTFKYLPQSLVIMYKHQRSHTSLSLTDPSVPPSV